jgi:hypothetical protein
MGLQHFNYFWWDSEGHRIILSGTFSKKGLRYGTERGSSSCYWETPSWDQSRRRRRHKTWRSWEKVPNQSTNRQVVVSLHVLSTKFRTKSSVPIDTPILRKPSGHLLSLTRSSPYGLCEISRWVYCLLWIKKTRDTDLWMRVGEMRDEKLVGPLSSITCCLLWINKTRTTEKT